MLRLIMMVLVEPAFPLLHSQIEKAKLAEQLDDDFDTTIVSF